MSAELLRKAGEALYGPRWQSDLSRDLGVSDRTMRRWAVSDDSLPAGVLSDILALTQARSDVLAELVEDLARAMSAERRE